MRKFLIIFFTIQLAFIRVSFSEQEEFIQTCNTVFAQKGVCPKRNCRLQCIAGFEVEDCPMVCKPIPCIEIKANFCPLHRCQFLDGCSEKKQCYYKMNRSPDDCGDLAYPGQEVECCAGLVKRCGVEFFDGTCDMEGLNSVYSVGSCLPCGNGICNQFENSCNCPEDCGEPNTSPGPDLFEFYTRDKSEE